MTLIGIKAAAAALWALVLFIFTCAVNLDNAFKGKVLIVWHPYSNYRDFFIFDDMFKTHSHVFIIKAGHFLGFAILDLLIYALIKHRAYSALLTIAFAVVTEILQLHTFRDGRLYDVLVDAAGVMASHYWLMLIQSRVLRRRLAE
ncbi:VanZ family protein [Paenibacillus hamazuiensis]|uniref:VanZ family protein n=1 Tax=Paenibacillus hamazuiensis TaxID=2936508 RepID=UPI00200E1485|nr:VanZ family protein [Paenibacillus hamazuiensis]